MARVGTSLTDWALREPGSIAALADCLPAAPPRATASTYIVLKRAIDCVLAVVMLALAAPVMLVAAAAVKCTSKGPVFFRQLRAGRGGRPFIVYKFRSMVDGAQEWRRQLSGLNELEGPVFKLRRDPRLTRVGRLLRRTSIDELPQLLNVLRGEMSLVGPRPLPLDELRASSPAERRRLDVLPGLTCLWQISGRCEIPYAEWMQLDLYYVQHRSLALDLQILLRTIPAVLSCRGAY